MTQTDLIFDIDMFVKMKEYEGYSYDTVVDALLEYIDIACDVDSPSSLEYAE